MKKKERLTKTVIQSFLGRTQMLVYPIKKRKNEWSNLLKRMRKIERIWYAEDIWWQ